MHLPKTHAEDDLLDECHHLREEAGVPQAHRSMARPVHQNLHSRHLWTRVVIYQVVENNPVAAACVAVEQEIEARRVESMTYVNQ